MFTPIHSCVPVALAVCGGLLVDTALASDCPPGEQPDCFGNCAPAHWFSDDVCDDGTFSYNGNPIYLNCYGHGHDGGACDPAPPVAGMPVPSMAALDVAVLDLMNEKNISAGAVGVMKNGRVVYQRFFGWKDSARSQPLLAGTMMRVASITKPQTAACIRALIADGVINLNDNVFDVGQPGGGLLRIAPFGGRLGDARLANVTVDHCLRHRGGWNRNSTFGVGDLTYREIAIKTAYAQDQPPTRMQTLNWIVSRPLQHSPGNQFAYSNIGYLVLGLIVEQYSGMDPVDYLHDRILADLGVYPLEVELGRSLPADRNPMEPWYDHQGSSWPNVFASLDALSTDPLGQAVARPDGGWHHEARVGQGGLIMTPRALLKFLDAYKISGIDIGSPRTKANEGPTWNLVHGGAFNRGTTAIAQQWGDGYNFVAMFNKRELDSEAPGYAELARDAFRALLINNAITVPDCPPNYLIDCDGQCVPEVWLGNDVCDTATAFGDLAANFNCLDLDWDAGDCDTCSADLDGNGAIDIQDLLAALAVFGSCATLDPCPGDLDGNGQVDINDLLVILADYGQPCS